MKKTSPIPSLTKSGFAEKVLRLKGKPYTLKEYSMFKDIYDLSDSVTERLLKTGRQVSKSTFNSKEILIDSMRIDHLNTLFVTPLQEQTSRFSRNYLADDIKNTPFIQKFYWDTSCQDNIFSRGLKNGSLVHLTYSLLDAERARGIPADKLVFDEVQDIPWDNIPIINECLSASPYKWRTYTGTPKTMDNTIERFWQRSTMCEWAVKCSFCHKINIPDEEHVWEMIGEESPVCYNCKNDLRNDIPSGEWVSRNPDPSKATIVGFHIPQIILPIHYKRQKQWSELKKKRDRYSPAQFANECLGLSYDRGGRLVTLPELFAISTGKFFEDWDSEIPCNPIYAGIDWGVSAQTSFTVLVIGGFDQRDGRFKVIYIKRFSSIDILEQIDEILDTCHRFNVLRIGADCGVGHTNNLILKRNYGEDRVVPFNYSTANRVLKYNPKRDFFALDKTSSLNYLFMALKQKQIELPPRKVMTEFKFYDDFLSVYEEIVESSRGLNKIFTHNKSDPDDVVHALNFCLFLGYLDQGHPITNLATSHQYLLDDLDE